MIGQGIIFISELSLIAALSAMLLALDPWLAIAAIVFFGFVAVVLQLALGRWALRAGQTLATTDVSSLDAIQEAMNVYREIAVANRRDLYVARIQQLRWSAAKHASDLQFISTLPKYVFEVALVLGSFALAGVLFTTQDSANAVGTLALFVVAATRIMPSILRLQGSALAMRNAAGSAAMTLELAQALESSNGSPSGYSSVAGRESRASINRGDFRPVIELSEVSFTYPGSATPAIRGVTVEAPPGSSVALVGASGAGKSTLVDIVLGVLQPQAGRVTIGAVPPLDAIRDWPGAIAYVPQDVALANGTIRANVALGRPEDAVDDALVRDALERAHLSGVLQEGREGLDTVIGERGVRLSGGQRQRLGIARALYTRPRLLVLDEATSSLDAETEAVIAETITEMEGTVTTLVVAHRLSTVRNADLVVYLDRGSVLAIGSFASVRERVPAFEKQAQLMGLS